jgi:peptide chain release factor 1
VDTNILDKVEMVRSRLSELGPQLADPQLLNQHKLYREVAREHTRLEEIVNLADKLLSIQNKMDQVLTILNEESEPELIAMASDEKAQLEVDLEKTEKALKHLLIPPDPNDSRNVIIEIRAGTGGEESALFAADLFRMYMKYAEIKHWKLDVLNTHPTDIGGFKEVIFLVEGDFTYAKLKYEAGVHRVQRVPVTESQGRIHTSAASVAVLPEAEEVEIEISLEDLRIDVFRSTGPGGQSVNTTDSAVRITHLPSGMVVTCQDEKSQLKNKNKAMKVLKSRLLELKQQEKQAETAETRRVMIGSGDRSEKIRTYNYPQSRVTDHRIGLTLYRLEEIMNGDIEEIIDALTTADEEQKLKHL